MGLVTKMAWKSGGREALPRCSLETCPHSFEYFAEWDGGAFFLRKTHISQAGMQPSYVAKFDLELLTLPTIPPSPPTSSKCWNYSCGPLHPASCWNPSSQWWWEVGASGEAPLKKMMMPLLGKGGPLRSGLLTKALA